MVTLQGINISHLWKRKIIFKMPLLGDMLVPWRVSFHCHVSFRVGSTWVKPLKCSNSRMPMASKGLVWDASIMNESLPMVVTGWPGEVLQIPRQTKKNAITAFQLWCLKEAKRLGEDIQSFYVFIPSTKNQTSNFWSNMGKLNQPKKFALQMNFLWVLLYVFRGWRKVGFVVRFLFCLVIFRDSTRVLSVFFEGRTRPSENSWRGGCPRQRVGDFTLLFCYPVVN